MRYFYFILGFELVRFVFFRLFFEGWESIGGIFGVMEGGEEIVSIFKNTIFFVVRELKSFKEIKFFVLLLWLVRNIKGKYF